MIQRIQSLFLFLASGAAFSGLALPFASGSETALFADGVYNANDHIGIMVSFAVAGALALAAIFLYKNRKLQSQLAALAAIAVLAAIGFGGWAFWKGGTPTAYWTIWVAVPVLAVILALLARRFIHKDEKLVRSMDRLR